MPLRVTASTAKPTSPMTRPTRASRGARGRSAATSLAASENVTSVVPQTASANAISSGGPSTHSYRPSRQESKSGSLMTHKIDGVRKTNVRAGNHPSATAAPSNRNPKRSRRSHCSGHVTRRCASSVS